MQLFSFLLLWNPHPAQATGKHLSVFVYVSRILSHHQWKRCRYLCDSLLSKGCTPAGSKYVQSYYLINCMQSSCIDLSKNIFTSLGLLRFRGGYYLHSWYIICLFNSTFLALWGLFIFTFLVVRTEHHYTVWSTSLPTVNSMCSNIYHSEFLVFGCGPVESLVIGARQGIDWILGAWYLEILNSWWLMLGRGYLPPSPIYLTW